jgi:hypothetical protein
VHKSRWSRCRRSAREIDQANCHWYKAALDGGVDYANSLLDQAAEQKLDPQTWLEQTAQQGYGCTPVEELPAAPTPEELDKQYEKPAADPQAREIQCGPQSNASPEFREKYC